MSAIEKVKAVQEDEDKISGVLSGIKQSLEDITGKIADHLSQKAELLEKREKYLKRKKIFAHFCHNGSSKTEAMELVQEIDCMIDELNQQSDNLGMKIERLTLDKERKELEVAQYKSSLKERKEAISKLANEIDRLRALLIDQRREFDEKITTFKAKLQPAVMKKYSIYEDIDDFQRRHAGKKQPIILEENYNYNLIIVRNTNYENVREKFAGKKPKEDISSIPEMHLSLSYDDVR